MPYVSAHELARMIRGRKISAVEALEEHLGAIARHNPALNAVVTLDEEGARQQARAADEALARGGGAPGALHGVPMTLKDCHWVKGMRTTAGFPPLAEFVAPDDGTVASRLRAAGAVIMGHTNVPPMLMDWQSANPIFGVTNNPWDRTRTPGGSSGGAAAALAAGLTPLEVGSDIGGSVRVPAHFCGLFSLKPTDRRISLHGHIPEPPGTPRTARIMGVIGPMGRTLADVDLAFRLIAGPDLGDVDVPPVELKELPPPPIQKLRVAYATHFPGTYVAREIRAAVARLAGELERAGATVEEAMPEIDYQAQNQTFWGLLDHVTRVTDPTYAGPPLTLGGYFTLLQERDRFIAAWERFFTRYDLLLTPVGSVTAFTHREFGAPHTVDDQVVEYGAAFSASYQFSLTGHPVLTLPAGHDSQGLPIGVQVVGRRWSEDRLLAMGARLAEISGPFVAPPGY